VLIVAAPYLAEVALRFSSVEYFWLALLGLTCAAFIGSGKPVKGAVSLLIGLFVATIGLNNPPPCRASPSATSSFSPASISSRR
jgi:putative tricarboxylic transport membrane protein